MTDIRLWTSVAAAALLASAAQAQTSTFGIEDSAIDVVDEIRDDVDDDFERDLDTEGNAGRQLGYSGSIAGRVTALSGNNDDVNAGIGARYGFYDGVNGGEINFAFTYTDDGEDDTETSFFISTEYTRDFSDRFYAYAQGVGTFDDNPGEFDELEDDELSGQREDIFIGVGLGYRIIDTDRIGWAVQAGPGYRWYEGFDNATTPDDESERVEETAVSLSSDFIYQFTDTVALSNDTDVISSDDNTSVTNDLALVVGISEALQLRTSLLTEYNSDPAEPLKDTDNTLGVAVVYNF